MLQDKKYTTCRLHESQKQPIQKFNQNRPQAASIQIGFCYKTAFLKIKKSPYTQASFGPHQYQSLSILTHLSCLLMMTTELAEQQQVCVSPPHCACISIILKYIQMYIILKNYTAIIIDIVYSPWGWQALTIQPWCNMCLLVIRITFIVKTNHVEGDLFRLRQVVFHISFLAITLEKLEKLVVSTVTSNNIS